jgi:hypothetical protein
MAYWPAILKRVIHFIKTAITVLIGINAGYFKLFHVIMLLKACPIPGVYAEKPARNYKAVSAPVYALLYI